MSFIHVQDLALMSVHRLIIDIMKNLSFFNLLCFFVLLTFLSCGKDDPTPAQSTAVEISVKDGNSWTSSNTEMNIVSGAVIKMYDTQQTVNQMTPRYTATTDQSGKALIQVDFQHEYFFTVQKGNAKNLINGLLIIGIFQTQAEIQSSPNQTPAPSVGSPKFLDTNRDGVIRTPHDVVYGDYVDLVENETFKKTSILYE